MDYTKLTNNNFYLVVTSANMFAGQVQSGAAVSQNITVNPSISYAPSTGNVTVSNTSSSNDNGYQRGSLNVSYRVDFAYIGV